ncbi:MAG: hypothetical protein ACLQMT_04665 [Candidatus Acidiferrales bacterium]
MKRWGLLCAGILLFAGIASAQDTPKIETFLGYSYVYSSIGGTGIPGFRGTNFDIGGNGSVAFNLNKWFGVVGDFGGYHTGNLGSITHIGATVYSYDGGPQFSYRADKFTVFAHALFGGAHASLGGTGINSFDMKLGGGADVNLNERFAIRAIQADYALTRFNLFGFLNPASQNNLRISTGVVIKF